jgi:hypothetical protein
MHRREFGWGRSGLVRWVSRGPRGPILRSEINTPEMRARGKELNANPCAFFGQIANINDATFLLFFGDGIDQHHIRAEFERFLQVEQAAMSIDHDGLAVLAKFPAVGILARGADRDSREYARTASLIAA